MARFNIIDHTADIAVEIWGSDLEELFESGYLAWRELSIDPFQSESYEIKKMIFETNSIEELLVEFLSEINYLLHARKWYCGKMKNFSIQQDKEHYYLQAELWGNNLYASKKQVKEEIKAVTFHQMKVEHSHNKFYTKIIFDI